MASIIKANQLQDFGGNSIITSDGAGNLTTQKTLYPAFFAKKTSNQTISHATLTQVTFDTVEFDSNNSFNSNIFTIPVAGKYFVYYSILCDANAVNDLDFASGLIRINGTDVTDDKIDFRNGIGTKCTINAGRFFDFSVNNTVQIYVYIDKSSGSGSGDIESSGQINQFGAYRIGS